MKAKLAERLGFVARRPDDRPLRRLPQLADKKATLERCVFCPKLCRSACPVSNAEPRETLTPWGKMSMAYFAANESVPLTESFARPAWACTGCFGCREHCNHRNDVTGTLFAARDALSEAAPPAARRVLERFDDSALKSRGVSHLALLVGCENARAGNEDAVAATEKLLGPVETVGVCCGAPLLYAGDRARFAEQRKRFARATAGKRVIAADAGCASTLRVHHGLEAEHFVEVVARAVDRLSVLESLGRVRWHDPCQLGRGLGLYEQPRAILTSILGHAPEEFIRHRADGRCSGAGGLLPVTMPEVSREIARERIADHDASGGGTIVTACASSLRSFRKGGADAIDIASLVLRALA